MRASIWNNWSLAVKLTLTMTVLVVAAVAAVTLLASHREEKTFREELKLQAELLLDAIEASNVNPTGQQDSEILSELISALVADRMILTEGRLYDAQGQILADAFNNGDPPVNAIDPLGKRLIESSETVFEWQSHQLIAGRSLWNGNQQIGAVSIGLPTEPVEQKITALQQEGIAVALVAAVIGMALALWLSRSMTDPLQELVTATRRAAQGDLSERVRVGSGDEFGTLARAFNFMAEQLEETLDQLQASEERYALAERGANDGLWDWDLRSDQIYFSPRWKAMLGYSADEISGTKDEWFGRVHPEDLKQLKVALSQHLVGMIPHFESEHRILHKEGDYRWVLSRGLAVTDSEGAAYRIAGSQTDITGRKRAEEQLIHDALHDALTGLPNRALFMDRLGRAIEHSKRRENYLYAVLFLDLDRFKVINDSLGHTVGDQLLLAISRRLELFLRSVDTVARLGGDEFVILIEDIQGLSDATRIAERIQNELSLPFKLNEHSVFTSVSIGIVLSQKNYETPEEVLRDADIAMYRAKALGRARFEVFDTAMRTRAMARLELETDLRKAIGYQQFEVFYQPIVSLDDDRITGFEALVRWRHPERGLIAPEEFIPVAEETGLIIPIDWWVLRQACQQLSEWRKQFQTDPPLTISVNLSSKHFAQHDLVTQVENILHVTGLDGGSLQLEITESVFMEYGEKEISVLRALRELGVQLHIDDFGTGYSSLGYLQNFPVDTIKIDRTFVGKMGKETNNSEIVRTIVTLARELGMDAIAEGVETEEQLIQLKALNCEFGQGYIISRPMTSEAAEAIIAEACADQLLRRQEESAA